MIRKLRKERKYSAILVVLFWGLAVFVITVLARSIIIEISKEKQFSDASTCEEKILSLDNKIKDFMNFRISDLKDASDERSRLFFTITQRFKGVRKQCGIDTQKAIYRELILGMKENIDAIKSIDRLAREKLGKSYKKFEKNIDSIKKDK